MSYLNDLFVSIDSDLEDSPELHALTKEEKDNWEFIRTLIDKEGWSAFKYASYRIKDNKELVLQAINHNPYLLEFASERLRNDKKIVEKIIADWDGIEFFKGVNLPSDLEFISSYPMAVAGTVIRQDDEFCQSLGFQAFDREAAIEVIRSDEFSLKAHKEKIKKISPACWFDSEIVLEAISVSVEFLAFTAQELKEDLEFFTEALRICKCDVFRFVGEPWISNKSVMINAIKMDDLSYNFVSTALEDDLDILKARFEKYSGEDLYYAVGNSAVEDRFDLLEAIFLRDTKAFEMYVGECIEILPNDDSPEIGEEEDLDKYEGYIDFFREYRPSAEVVDFLIGILKGKGELIGALEGTIVTLIPEIILAAIPTFPDAIYSAARPVLNDPEFLLKAYKLKSEKL